MSNSDLITSESTKALWAYLCKKHKVKVVRKDKSLLMRAVGIILQALDIMSKKRFMNDFCTTHGKKIYITKNIKIGDGHMPWQCRLAVHEFTHIVQKVKVKYMYSKSARSKYESDAMLAEMEFLHWLDGIININYFITKLDAYALRSADLKAAELKFKLYAKEVRKGRYRSPVVKDCIKFLKNYGQK